MLRKGGTATLSGIVMSGYDFLRCFTSPVFGFYMYKIGPRFMLLAGTLVAAWCTTLFGLLHAFPPGVALFTIVAVVLRMTSGLGNNAYVVVSIAIRPVLFAGFMSLAFVSVCIINVFPRKIFSRKCNEIWFSNSIINRELFKHHIRPA